MMREIVSVLLLANLIGMLFSVPIAFADSNFEKNQEDKKNWKSNTILSAKAIKDAIKEISESKDDDNQKNENKIFAKLVAKLNDLPKIKDENTPTISPKKLDRAEKFKLLKSKIEKTNDVRVIVSLDFPFKLEGELSPSQAKEQRINIKNAQDSLMKLISSNRIKDVYRFEHLPLVVMTVDKQTLERLEASPLVPEIYEDELMRPMLTDSVPLIGAPIAWNNGFTGAGQTIAILDTGIDKNHPFLAEKVVSEACYSSTISSAKSTSVCPGGVSASTAVGSGVPCNVNGCSHGTLIAGVAAGKGETFSGVAKDANLISIKVFSKINDPAFCGSVNPCVAAFTSDVIKGLTQVGVLASSYNIASVNLSFGGSTAFSQPCDNDSRTESIDSLKALGIATVAASGNGGVTGGIIAPSCISSVVSVGSTTVDSHGSGLIDDQVSTFSNTAPILDLLAPGEYILSSVPGGLFDITSGTSLSTPHVAGAWALLKQNQPNASVDEILALLKDTGLPISHEGDVFPRIQPAAALSSLNSPIAVDDSGVGFETDEDNLFNTASVLTNDSDPNGDTLILDSFDIIGTLGLVTNNGDGTFGYNPNGQFEGLSQGQSSSDSFTYTISDGNGWTDTATVTIKINGLDDTPPLPTQKFLEIKGDPGSANAVYTVVVTGQITKGPNADTGDKISADKKTVNGATWTTGIDDFYFTGDIVSITANHHIFSFVDGVEIPNDSPPPPPPITQKFLEIKGDPGSANAVYTVVVTGQITKGPNADNNDKISADKKTVNGATWTTGIDDFYFTGDIVSITANHHIFSFVDGVEIPNDSPPPPPPITQKFLEIKGDPASANAVYTVVVTGQITKGPNADNNDKISADKKTVNGATWTTGIDDFYFTGDIVSITANHHIFSFVDGVEIPNDSPPL